MTAGQWFWIVYVLFAILGLAFNWPSNPSDRTAWRPFGWSLVVLILIGLLGLGVFGSPIK